MSMRDAATLMIIISDNSATNIVVDAVGLDYINEQMRRGGFENTVLFRRWEFDADTKARDTWVSTARETSALLTLVARHEAVSAEASLDMLRIMRRQDYRHELSRNLPWSEMNTLPDFERNWVAEKGGSSPGGIRCGGSIFHTARGSLAMAAFCEGGTAGGTGRESEGNVLLGALGEAAWRYLEERST
jgi:beta-lactamase class A